MKKLSISFIVLLTVSLVFTSCKEPATTEKKVTEEIESTEAKVDLEAEKTAKLKVMMHANPLPNYMAVALSNAEVLNIDEKQHQKLLEISKAKSPQAVKMAYRIGEIEAELHNASLDNAKKELLASGFEKSLDLRTSLATMKLDCRDQVLEILSEQQWNDLVVLYQEKMPFNNKTEMAALIEHVNPLPNYMQLIQNDVIKLDEGQDKKLSEWSMKNHPKMMEMAAEVNSLEKEAYELSINKAPREDILKNITEIAEIKRKIILTKTDCRDNLINNILSEEQWKELSSK